MMPSPRPRARALRRSRRSARWWPCTSPAAAARRSACQRSASAGAGAAAAAAAGLRVHDPGVMRYATQVARLVCDHDATRQLSRKPVIDLLALESREHAVRCRGRDELPLREQREECADGVWCRPVVFGVVERDVEVADPRLLERRVDIGAAEDVPEGERRAVV